MKFLTINKRSKKFLEIFKNSPWGSSYLTSKSLIRLVEPVFRGKVTPVWSHHTASLSVILQQAEKQTAPRANTGSFSPLPLEKVRMHLNSWVLTFPDKRHPLRSHCPGGSTTVLTTNYSLQMGSS